MSERGGVERGGLDAVCLLITLILGRKQRIGSQPKLYEVLSQKTKIKCWLFSPHPLECPNPAENPHGKQADAVTGFSD